jgi:hypothetical protein
MKNKLLSLLLLTILLSSFVTAMQPPEEGEEVGTFEGILIVLFWIVLALFITRTGNIILAVIIIASIGIIGYLIWRRVSKPKKRTIKKKSKKSKQSRKKRQKK